MTHCVHAYGHFLSERFCHEYTLLMCGACRDFWTIPAVMQCAENALTLGATESEVADILVEKALKRFTSDNVAVIVITFPWTRKLLDGQVDAAKSEKVKKRKAKFMGLF
jgi:hypothetical protein